METGASDGGAETGHRQVTASHNLQQLNCLKHIRLELGNEALLAQNQKMKRQLQKLEEQRQISIQIIQVKCKKKVHT